MTLNFTFDEVLNLRTAIQKQIQYYLKESEDEMKSDNPNKEYIECSLKDKEDHEDMLNLINSMIALETRILK